MSGSNGSGSWDDTGSVVSCDRLEIVTVVNSPDRATLERVRVGDVLDVDIVREGEREIVGVRYEGDLVGSITAPQVRRLLECLQDGHQYRAAVEERKGGVCRVRISVVVPHA